ncbi:MAG: type 1 glutamine amidotransferase [Gallionella sp.]|nr:type 1 glutamine amidotransferase [Gallionella sp.]
MKPVAVFRHSPGEGPGYFSELLDARGIDWILIAVDAGDAIPLSSSYFSGLVFMGGPMSVNDDLPWIAPVLALIRDAVERDIPVLGHCLGGQLMSKALGGAVSRNTVKEIGWGEVVVDSHEQARGWFGELRSFDAFHWHGETFSLPAGATHLLSSSHCANQAWSIGKHLALQCHVEMTMTMITHWCEIGANEIAEAAASPVVQFPTQIIAEAVHKLPSLNQVAEQLYSRWLTALKY